jgi:hypothetical protein
MTYCFRILDWSDHALSVHFIALDDDGQARDHVARMLEKYDCARVEAWDGERHVHSSEKAPLS